MDELKPMSNRSHNWLGLGATLVDCLDNLWIFGMKEEFKRAQAKTAPLKSTPRLYIEDRTSHSRKPTPCLYTKGRTSL